MQYWQLFKISARNLFRNRRRTLITLFILTLSSVGLVAMGGFFDRLLFLLREAYIRTGSGHLQISKQNFNEKGTTQPFDYLLDNYSQLKRELKKNPAIEHLAPTIKFGGMLTNDDTSIPIIAVGVDPNVDMAMGNVSLIKGGQRFVNVVEGEYLSPDDPYGIIIGEDMKKALGTQVGDTVEFITTQRLGAIEGAEFHVRGVYQAAFKELGERMIKMPIETAQKIWAIPDQVHTVSVHLDNTDDTLLVKGQLENMPELRNWKLDIIPWNQLGLAYQQSMMFLTRIYRILQTIIAIIILFSIANTINMNLLERIKEYGTMMAIGCNRSTVFTMIVTEAGLMGLLGGAFGLVFSVLTAIIISHSGLEIPPPPMTATSTRLKLVIMLSPRLLIETFWICFFSTLLSSLLPAIRAVRFRIVRALGYV